MRAKSNMQIELDLTSLQTSYVYRYKASLTYIMC